MPISKRERAVATADSLNKSRQLADLLGVPFDEQAVESDANQLLYLYFEEIKKALPDATQHYHFLSYGSRDFTASAGRDRKGNKIIEIDEHWSFFLYNANIILCIWACIVLDDSEKAELVQLFRESLNAFSNKEHHEDFRERMWPTLVRHVKVLALANLLTAAMVSYLICHELAHHNLHHLDQPHSHHTEFEADELGYSYFCKIIEQFGTLKKLKVTPNMHGAPLIGFEYLKAAEWVYNTDSNGSHPLAKERIRRLTPLFEQYASAESKELWTGLQASSVELLEAAQQLG
ncbi:hypothetical protein AB835_11705 [Candidatus Endobugula sertula]|uniref:Uncharacterized protein n=1 Tax=Candidatus Endobugula sertula TaxID=62101 RepID=A0A1D2QMW3_9GAMM|nr:hypothetical protein AB835_11705 [Candidatus Endobugula sertula]